ncbi:MAG: DUF302 domain-containing protein [Chromatiales bacterium]|nr:DUF302 domain-containing protein [Gammaproteobacteria bacterium]MBW6477337.1 DUF302 domain-containing protein [Chromatiales bacterium]
MRTIRNFFALIGLLSILGAVFVYSQYGERIQGMMGEYRALQAMDPMAAEVYRGMWDKLKETGNAADATVWRVPLAEGIGPKEAEESMKMIANSRNIMFVAEQPLSEQVALMTGEKQRLLKIYQFCNPLTAIRMVDYSDAFSAYFPCRIAMIEDKHGSYALYSLNMDLMIHGGRSLPPELFAETQHVKEVMLAIMEGGARGDFE